MGDPSPQPQAQGLRVDRRRTARRQATLADDAIAARPAKAAPWRANHHQELDRFARLVASRNAAAKRHVAEPTRLWCRIKSAGAIVLETPRPEFLMAWETTVRCMDGRTGPRIWRARLAARVVVKPPRLPHAARPAASAVDGADRFACRRTSVVCGLKPTPGRVPATGHPGVGWTVRPAWRRRSDGADDRDLALLFEVIAGPDNGDPSRPSSCKQSIATLLRTRIGYFDDDGSVPVTAETRIAIQRTVQTLRDEGSPSSPLSRKGWTRRSACGTRCLSTVLPWSRLQVTEFGGRDAFDRPSDSPHVRTRFALTTKSLLDMLVRRDIVRTKFFAQMKHYPILVFRSAPFPLFGTVNGRGPSATRRTGIRMRSATLGISTCSEIRLGVVAIGGRPRACRSGSDRRAGPSEEERGAGDQRSVEQPSDDEAAERSTASPSADCRARE